MGNWLLGLAGLSWDFWPPKPGDYATLDLRSGGLLCPCSWPSPGPRPLPPCPCPCSCSRHTTVLTFGPQMELVTPTCCGLLQSTCRVRLSFVLQVWDMTWHTHSLSLTYHTRRLDPLHLDLQPFFFFLSLFLPASRSAAVSLKHHVGRCRHQQTIALSPFIQSPFSVNARPREFRGQP